MALTILERRNLQKRGVDLYGQLKGKLSISEKRKMQAEFYDVKVKLGVIKATLDTDKHQGVDNPTPPPKSDTPKDDGSIDQKTSVEHAPDVDAGKPTEIQTNADKATPTDQEIITQGKAALVDLVKRGFIETKRGQAATISDALRGEERVYFGKMMIDLKNRIDSIPKVYGQDGKGDNATVYLHYFTGGSDFYVTEVNSAEDAYGYAILNGDTQNAEVGYMSIEEYTQAGVELDLHWELKPLSEVKAAKGARVSREDKETARIQNMFTSLDAGEFDSKTPQEFIAIVREIANTLGVEAVKHSTVRYMESHMPKAE